MSKYYHYFDKEITTETINELIDRLYPIEGKINLFFSTQGGHSNSMTILIEFLNSRKEDIEITLVGAVVSAGTRLLTDFEGKITIGDLDYILFHVIDRERYTLRKDIIIDDNMLTKQDYKDNLVFAEKLKKKGILNDKQIKKYLSGKDVVLYRKDFKNVRDK